MVEVLREESGPGFAQLPKEIGAFCFDQLPTKCHCIDTQATDSNNALLLYVCSYGSNVWMSRKPFNEESLKSTFCYWNWSSYIYFLYLGPVSELIFSSEVELELACFSSKIMCFLVLPGPNYKINKFEC